MSARRRLTPTTNDYFVLKIYPPGANPDTTAPIYQASGSLSRGNAIRVKIAIVYMPGLAAVRAQAVFESAAVRTIVDAAGAQPGDGPAGGGDAHTVRVHRALGT
jgi:hypothetical protein